MVSRAGDIVYLVDQNNGKPPFLPYPGGYGPTGGKEAAEAYAKANRMNGYKVVRARLVTEENPVFKAMVPEDYFDNLSSYVIEDLDQPGMKINVASCQNCGALVMTSDQALHRISHSEGGK